MRRVAKMLGLWVLRLGGAITSLGVRWNEWGTQPEYQRMMADFSAVNPEAGDITYEMMNAALDALEGNTQS